MNEPDSLCVTDTFESKPKYWGHYSDGRKGCEREGGKGWVGVGGVGGRER